MPREASRRLAVELVGRLPLLTQEKGKVRLCDYRDRGAGSTLGRPPEGADAAPLIDVLHRALWLAEERPLELRDFVAASVVDADQLRLVAQALSGAALTRKGVGTTPGEQSAIQSLLASWRRLVETTLEGMAR